MTVTRGREATRVAATVAWLIDGARSARRPEDVLGELCARLVDEGLPLWRVAVFVRTPHPNVMGRRFLWRRGAGVAISEADFGVLERSTFRNSPMPIVFTRAETIRRRLCDPACPRDFEILDELVADGVTDYLAQPLLFANGEAHAVTWSTDRAGGFTDDDLAGLDAVLAPLARVAEAYALRRLATTVLDTYVGHHSGERILAGHIRRGDVQRIHAAILLADLRGFTAISEAEDGEALISLLNAFFDCMVGPIEAAGGEVLKFIGDGVLAIFPGPAIDPATMCAGALDAALGARARLAEANAGRAGRGEFALRMGLALHVGTIWYGNIGAAHRLDFTAIGPAVNRTARLEGVARDRGVDIVASAAFARTCPGRLRPLGEVTLRGFAAPETVFTPL